MNEHALSGSGREGPAPSPAARPQREAPSGDRWFGSTLAASAAALGLLLLLVALAVTRIAWPSIRSTGLGFVTRSTWDPLHGTFGALAFVWGTVYVALVALVLAVPVGLGVALFLTDLGPRRLRHAVSALIDLLAAIPSVVYGLWAALVMAPILRTTVEPVLGVLGGPLFRGPYFGLGYLCAALVLAVMLVPTIAIVSRNVLRAVPSSLREGALALGATPWDVVRLVVLPRARSGLAGTILLALGRALGETMAVAAVIGSRPEASLSLFAPGYTMSSVIANEFPAALEQAHVAALAEVGLLLFAVTVVFNATARVLVTRSTREAGA